MTDVIYQNGWPVPAGWELVPVEPTPKMEMAARNHHSLTTHYEDHRISIWRAMLAAAPTPPAQASGQAPAADGGAQPLTDEQKAILKECRNHAMTWAVKARIPECGEFGRIAQDLDYLCEQLGVNND